jgi:hypothetical protein
VSKKSNLYLGKAGQMAVMSEFLARGWNVAVPEVDVGDDLSRIQVKTGSAKETRNEYGGSSLSRCNN